MDSGIVANLSLSVDSSSSASSSQSDDLRSRSASPSSSSSLTSSFSSSSSASPPVEAAPSYKRLARATIRPTAVVSVSPPDSKSYQTTAIRTDISHEGPLRNNAASLEATMQDFSESGASSVPRTTSSSVPRTTSSSVPRTTSSSVPRTTSSSVPRSTSGFRAPALVSQTEATTTQPLILPSDQLKLPSTTGPSLPEAVKAAGSQLQPLRSSLKVGHRRGGIIAQTTASHSSNSNSLGSQPEKVTKVVIKSPVTSATLTDSQENAVVKRNLINSSSEITTCSQDEDTVDTVVRRRVGGNSSRGSRGRLVQSLYISSSEPSISFQSALSRFQQLTNSCQEAAVSGSSGTAVRSCSAAKPKESADGGNKSSSDLRCSSAVDSGLTADNRSSSRLSVSSCSAAGSAQSPDVRSSNSVSRSAGRSCSAAESGGQSPDVRSSTISIRSAVRSCSAVEAWEPAGGNSSTWSQKSLYATADQARNKTSKESPAVGEANQRIETNNFPHVDCKTIQTEESFLQRYRRKKRPETAAFGNPSEAVYSTLSRKRDAIAYSPELEDMRVLCRQSEAKARATPAPVEARRPLEEPVFRAEKSARTAEHRHAQAWMAAGENARSEDARRTSARSVDDHLPRGQSRPVRGQCAASLYLSPYQQAGAGNSAPYRRSLSRSSHCLLYSSTLPFALSPSPSRSVNPERGFYVDVYEGQSTLV